MNKLWKSNVFVSFLICICFLQLVCNITSRTFGDTHSPASSPSTKVRRVDTVISEFTLEKIKHPVRNRDSVQIVQSGDRVQQFNDITRKLFDSDLKSRSDKKQTVCQAHAEVLSWDEDEVLQHMQSKDLWDSKLKVVYCPIAKVASTSWHLNFLQMAGIDKKMIKNMVGMTVRPPSEGGRPGDENFAGEQGGKGTQELARYFYPAPPMKDFFSLEKEFESLEGFMIVRHPFVRLVSAYEDKMANPHPFPYKYHHSIQEEIKRKRKNKNQTIDFPQDLIKSKKYQRNLAKKLITLEQLRTQPSFEEFVDWLIRDRENKDDSLQAWKHDFTWTPLYTVCPVCNLNYSIIKLDGERDELNLFIERQNLPLKQSLAVHAVGGKKSSERKASAYFQTLSKHQIDSLVAIYKYDFQLFGYEYQNFYGTASDS